MEQSTGTGTRNRSRHCKFLQEPTRRKFGQFKVQRTSQPVITTSHPSVDSFSTQTTCNFCRAMQMLCKCGLYRHAVSVCSSVRHVRESKRINMCSKCFHHQVVTPADCSYIFSYQTSWHYFDRNLLTGASNAAWVCNRDS